MVGIGDTSFKTEDKSVGVFLFIANSKRTRAAPINWKSKQID